jgi:hypothetical protein
LPIYTRVQLPSLRSLEVYSADSIDGILAHIEPTSMLRKLVVTLSDENVPQFRAFVSDVKPHIEYFSFLVRPEDSICVHIICI